MYHLASNNKLKMNNVTIQVKKKNMMGTTEVPWVYSQVRSSPH